MTSKEAEAQGPQRNTDRRAKVKEEDAWHVEAKTEAGTGPPDWMNDKRRTAAQSKSRQREAK